MFKNFLRQSSHRFYNKFSCLVYLKWANTEKPIAPKRVPIINTPTATALVIPYPIPITIIVLANPPPNHAPTPE